MNTKTIDLKIRDYNFIKLLKLCEVRSVTKSTIIREALNIFLTHNQDTNLSYFNNFNRQTLFSKNLQVRLPVLTVSAFDEMCINKCVNRVTLINIILGYYLNNRESEIKEYEDLWGKITIEKGGTIYEPKMFERSV